MNITEYDIIVIGGGPAGMMIAGRAGEVGSKVLLIEKNNRLGKKLSITGGRRCNITNAEFDVSLFLESFPEAKQYLDKAFAQFSVKDTFEFFESRGLPLMVEDKKRAFPKSEKAEDVCNVLIEYIEQSGNVEVMLNTALESFIVDGGKLVGVQTSSGKYYAKKIVVATGGLAAPKTGSTGEGLSMLASIGHTVKEPNPSLVPLKSSAEWVHSLSGLSVDNVLFSFIQNNEVKHSVKGRVLFTHFGISGPTVINSAYIAKELLKKGELLASIDLFPNSNHKQVDSMLKRIFEEKPKRLLKGAMRDLLQNRLADTILDIIDPKIGDLKVSSVSKMQRKSIATLLKGLSFPITGTMGLDWSIVADGGVEPEEIDFASMKSTIFSNLYLVGDTININRPSGGFSLQLCWTTGWVAGTHATRNV